MDFVDAQTGWVSGGLDLMATKDGGTTWQSEETSPSPFRALDFVSPLAGWAVASERLLGTTDGGATWTQLGEPDEFLVNVDFVSESVGWGIASCASPELPACSSTAQPQDQAVGDGKLAKTQDGGRTWSNIATPVAAQSLCAADEADLWVAGGGEVYHSADGGGTWSHSFTVPPEAQGETGWYPTLRCAQPHVAWAQFADGVAAGHRGYIVYKTLDGVTWKPVMAEAYTNANAIPVPAAPGSYPGDLAVVDASNVFVMGSCPVCGGGPFMIRSSADGGATWTPDTTLPTGDTVLYPIALDFVDDRHGWAAFATDTEALLLATSDGGRTWRSVPLP